MVQFGLRLHDAEKLPLEELLPIVKGKDLAVSIWLSQRH